MEKQNDLAFGSMGKRNCSGITPDS